MQFWVLCRILDSLYTLNSQHWAISGSWEKSFVSPFTHVCKMFFERFLHFIENPECVWYECRHNQFTWARLIKICSFLVKFEAAYNHGQKGCFGGVSQLLLFMTVETGTEIKLRLNQFVFNQSTKRLKFPPFLQHLTSLAWFCYRLVVLLWNLTSMMIWIIIPK